MARRADERHPPGGETAGPRSRRAIVRGVASRRGPRRLVGRLVRSLLVLLGLSVVEPLSGEPLARAAMAQTDDWARWRGEGAEHYRAKRFFPAIEAFRRALAEAPPDRRDESASDLSRALAGLGLEYLDAGESRRAEESFREALEVRDDWFARFGMGYLHVVRRQDGAALTHLLESLRQRDDYALTHKLLGLLSYRSGSTKEALERLERARALDPADTETQQLIARWRAEARVTGEFDSVSTRRFRVRVDPRIPAGSRGRLLDELDRVYDEIGERLGAWPADPIPAVLFSEERFHAATGMEHWVGGYYDGQLKLPVAVASSARGEAAVFDDLRAVLRHEYAHVVVRSLAPECPMWLNEGIAQHLEGRAQRDAVYRGLGASAEKRVPLTELPARVGAIDDVELARRIYLEALGFVEFLAGRFGRFRLQLLLRAIDDEGSATRGFERVYGRSLEALEAEFWSEVDAAGSR